MIGYEPLEILKSFNQKFIIDFHSIDCGKFEQECDTALSKLSELENINKSHQIWLKERVTKCRIGRFLGHIGSAIYLGGFLITTYRFNESNTTTIDSSESGAYVAQSIGIVMAIAGLVNNALFTQLLNRHRYTNVDAFSITYNNYKLTNFKNFINTYKRILSLNKQLLDIKDDNNSNKAVFKIQLESHLITCINLYKRVFQKPHWDSNCYANFVSMAVHNLAVEDPIRKEVRVLETAIQSNSYDKSSYLDSYQKLISQIIEKFRLDRGITIPFIKTESGMLTSLP